MRIKPTDLQPIHSVYWASLDTHTDAKTEGYVGIAMDHKRRERDHRRKGLLPPGFRFTLLATNKTREEAARIEWEHRPARQIGWNTRKGGGKFGLLFERSLTLNPTTT
jgi:hypothetical protein